MAFLARRTLGRRGAGSPTNKDAHRVASHPPGTMAPVARETSFVFTVDADPETDAVLSRHAGASRFAFNQCLRGVKVALDERDKSPQPPRPSRR